MPRKLTETEIKAFNYLNGLRDSGVTNMYGARPYIETYMKVEPREAIRLLKLWMENFDENGDYAEKMIEDKKS